MPESISLAESDTPWAQLAMTRLKTLLPEDFEVRVHESGDSADDADAVWEIRDSHSGIYTQVVVDAKQHLTPKVAATSLRDKASLLRRLMPNTSILVVTPWLGQRTRDTLEEQGVNYLDLTGNVYLRLRRPAVFVRLQGSNRDPAPDRRGPVRLTGARANRLVRAIVDVRPPYRATDLVRTTGLSPGYVSRSLEALDEMALIQRRGRGAVEEVDWPGLLQLRAQSYDLFRSNETTTFTAQRGWESSLADVPVGLLEQGLVAVTGSVAAVEIAPTAAPHQLVLYVADHDVRRQIQKACRLLPTQRGADVALAVPADESQLYGATKSARTPRVALSQLVLDCLAGNGRLPQEGEAVLAFMREHESEWRLRRLDELPWPR